MVVTPRVTLHPTASRAARAIATSAAVALVAGGIPGARLRAMVRDDVAPPRLVHPRAISPGDRGSVFATVLSRPGGAPIAGARVRAFSIADDRAYSAGEQTTDAAGHARFTDLARGEAWVVADAPGRARASTHLIVGVDVTGVTLELDPGHSLGVVVRDELGAAIAGAEIEIASASDPLPIGARTGEDGSARVERLQPAPWHVTAHAAGYEDARAEADRDGETIAMALRKLGSLDVRVHEIGDLAAPGAHVLLAGAALWPPRSAETDEYGKVRIGGLAAGTYALRATKRDEASPIELGLALGRGEHKAVDLQLAKGRFLSVFVTDGDGDAAGPIAGARVTLAEGEISPFPIEATTDAGGRARLGPFAPGVAAVAARADGFVARGAVIVPEPPPPEARVVLVQAGVLTGRVLDGAGRPIDGASIQIVGTDPAGGPIFDDPRRARFQAAHFAAMLPGAAPLMSAGELGVVPGPVPAIPLATSFAPAPGLVAVEPSPDSGSWVTRGDGTFRLSPASPGRIRAIVHHPQYVDAQSDLVVLAPGGQANVEVTMREGGTLEGRVLDARDDPVAGARVFVAATQGTLERTTRTATDGTFALASLPGSISVEVSATDSEMPDFRTAIEIPDGGREELTIRLPAPRDSISVAVVDERGDPIDTAQITATSLSADSLLRSTVFTSADGEAEIKRARGLPLRVEVRAPERAPKVIVTTGGEAALRVELVPGESASGDVFAAREGNPIGQAEVTLYTELGARHATTDAQGNFTLSGLGPGSATLRVRASGYAPIDATVTIPDSGGRRPFAMPRIEMAAEGIVEGDVVDAHGAPVAGARVARDRVPTWLPVGSSPRGMALTDGQGHFRLGDLPEGTVTLEAYAPDFGRTQATAAIVSGRTTDGVRLSFAQGPAAASPGEAASAGSVAVTLGETGQPTEVIVVSVVEGSEAERSGLSPGDVLLSVDGAPVRTMDEARARLSGPLSDDVLVEVRRGDREITLRVGREAVRR